VKFRFIHSMLLTYKFKKGLIRTSELLHKLSMSKATLDFWKSQWNKKHQDKCWNMGMRLIGKNAYWDPIMFVEWICQYKLKNKPTQPEQIVDHKKLILFVKNNVMEKSL